MTREELLNHINKLGENYLDSIDSKINSDKSDFETAFEDMEYELSLQLSLAEKSVKEYGKDEAYMPQQLIAIGRLEGLKDAMGILAEYKPSKA